MTLADPLKAAALRLLARREHSVAELTQKLERRASRAAFLARRGVDPQGLADSEGLGGEAPDPRQAIERAVQELTARGLQSDARVAESVLAAQARRHGQRRLAQTLKAKGLDAGLVESSLASVRESEYERALRLWRQRFGHAPDGSATAASADPCAERRADLQREAARQARFLLSRGFESEVVRRVLRSAGDEALAAAAEAEDTAQAGSADA
ncbi:MAG: RecX family transcriptional regulator [Rubrivivax sp.]|nr:RecX family transcriptional regulator [Rubrivivax sp.]